MVFFFETSLFLKKSLGSIVPNIPSIRCLSPPASFCKDLIHSVIFYLRRILSITGPPSNDIANQMKEEM